MKNLITACFLLIDVISGFGQKQELTLKDAILGGMSNVYSQSPSQLQWIPSSSNLSFVDDNNIISQPAESADTSILLSLEDLNTALKLDEALKSIPRFTWKKRIRDFLPFGFQLLYP